MTLTPHSFSNDPNHEPPTHQSVKLNPYLSSILDITNTTAHLLLYRNQYRLFVACLVLKLPAVQLLNLSVRREIFMLG